MAWFFFSLLLAMFSSCSNKNDPNDEVYIETVEPIGPYYDDDGYYYDNAYRRPAHPGEYNHHEGHGGGHEGHGGGHGR